MSYIGNTAQNQSFAPGIDYFSGNGSTVAFTLTRPVNTASQMLVFVANVPQNPSTAFTISGSTLTFTSAPPSGTNNIWVEYTSLITNTIVPGQGTVGVNELSATGSPDSTKYLRGDNTWAAVSGGALWQSVQTANFTAVAGNAYPINTTSAAITVNLPASPTAGQYVIFTDYAATWGTNNLTIARNGSNISGNASNVVMAISSGSVSLVYIDSTKGWIAYNGFTSGSPISSYSATYLVVAGGGGAGGGSGGYYGTAGAGAGGLLASSTTFVPGSAYTITIGAGGAGVVGPGTGGNGSNSSLGSVAVSVGGGSGVTSSAGRSGGSGGGGDASSNSVGGAGTSGQGYAGGNGNGNPSGLGASGGGGGAGGAGANGSATANGPGGAGGNGVSSSISGTATYYAGGGGGGAYNTTQSSNGGLGGGGSGGLTAGTSGYSGTTNTGGGGGGTNGSASGTFTGGSGGSGIVIISYAGAQRATGGTVTSAAGYTIHTFTSSGTYTA